MILTVIYGRDLSTLVDPTTSSPAAHSLMNHD